MSFLDESCASLPQISLGPGTVLLSQDDKSGKLYVLIEGEVAVLRGDVVVATVSDPGAVFGEMSILLDVPHTASVKVVRPSRVYVVENAETFLQSAPGVLRHIAMLLAMRLQSATGYLADVKRQFAESRNHLGMIDEVLESLLHQQTREFSPGPARDADPRL